VAAPVRLATPSPGATARLNQGAGLALQTVAPEMPPEVQLHEKDEVQKEDEIARKKPRSPAQDRSVEENPR
jgi:hypothetical protein